MHASTFPPPPPWRPDDIRNAGPGHHDEGPLWPAVAVIVTCVLLLVVVSLTT
ncbi:hypothetical protein [Gordonia bronchialis]|uniref:hypothetical protein n=1 Tax=Gordonia bronchialis TaxID=2054 RepID=UPI0003255DAB|nr:hypothetical protein [Gordonia bronchialis]MCC3321961.1 hypothetical protein [Gordonia bronchialis]UAK36810.1 hypothetical protein K8O93_16455 [Gordonia bronchialis]